MSVIMIVIGGRRCGGGLNHVCRHHKPPLSFIDYRYEVILRRGHVCRGGMLRGVAGRGEASCTGVYIFYLCDAGAGVALVTRRRENRGMRRPKTPLCQRRSRLGCVRCRPMTRGYTFLAGNTLESWPTDAWRDLPGALPATEYPNAQRAKTTAKLRHSSFLTSLRPLHRTGGWGFVLRTSPVFRCAT